MVILGLGTAAPPQRYAQRDGWDAVQQTSHFRALTPRSRAILKKILTSQNGIVTRHLALDLVGQGCGAAIPNLRTGEALLKAERCRRVLSICVEVCSAAFFLDDDPGVLVSACLFGDGAGAAVLSAQSNGKRRVGWKTSGSLLNPRDRDLLRFEQRQGMLRNILAAKVADL